MNKKNTSSEAEHQYKDNKTDSTALSLVKYVSNNAVKGTMNLSGAKKLADSYLLDQRYKNNDERVKALIKNESNKNFLSGFVTGLGGVFTLPISIPAAMGASSSTSRILMRYFCLVRCNSPLRALKYNSRTTPTLSTISIS